ncbi:DUF2089 family protein [Nonomuraea antimicrobica]|uniref:DUF2089 family protein n=1 Tax=Nonomuraea antimicrobica TaxID=561173 RepID=UPI0036143483
MQCHGSIKQMERIFGVSYPTIKARLNRVARAEYRARRADAGQHPGAAAVAEGRRAVGGWLCPPQQSTV